MEREAFLADSRVASYNRCDRAQTLRINADFVAKQPKGRTPTMLQRKPVFQHVIEMNVQAGQRLGCNVYLVFDKTEWVLIDVGYQETVDQIVDLIRQMDFPLSNCKTVIATHADVDHIQGLAKIKAALKTTATGHPKAAEPLAKGDRLKTFAEVESQNIHLEMPPVKLDALINEGDTIGVGDLKLEVWH